MYENQNRGPNETYGSLLRELVAGVTDLFRKELFLAQEEAKVTASRLASHASRVAVFGALLAFSVLPFLAFLVIGLGSALDGRYWLSSLIIAVACGALGGGLAYRSWKKIMNTDLKLPHTREMLEREIRAVSSKLEDVRHSTKRRAV